MQQLKLGGARTATRGLADPGARGFSCRAGFCGARAGFFAVAGRALPWAIHGHSNAS